MDNILAMGLSAAIASAVVYFIYRFHSEKERGRIDRLREDAERGKSNAEVSYRAKCDELERLRKDDADDLKRQADQFHDEIKALNLKLEAAEKNTMAERDKKESLSEQLVAAEHQLKAKEELLQEKELQYKKTLEQGEARFKDIAQRILEDREKKLKEDGTGPLNEIVTQLKQDIENFKKNITDSRVDAGEKHKELMVKIANLVEQTNNVTEQANNLAGAIRGDAQFTGEWGEIQLKRILDLAGMQENSDYTYQETFRGDDGRKSKRTDFVVKMPGGRSLIIDSKTTVAGVELYHSASDDDTRANAAEEILSSIRTHVDEISSAEYQKSVPNALSTVLMYIPIEEVYILAMKSMISVSGQHELLREYARRRNVVFVNSSSVIPVVRLVEMMWTVERTEKNRQETIRAAEELLARANAFISDFNAIGDAFKEVFAKYESAKAGLIDAPGGQSIAKSVAKLVRLGVQPKTRGGKNYTLADPVTAELESNL